jgi:serine/threonine protein kinase
MNDTQAGREPLDLLAEEFAQRCRRGEHPPVSEFVQRHPELGDELRDLLPAVALLESARRQASAGQSNGEPLRRLGDFRLLREVGRGGMGIVYEAVQESLGRRVALKVLPGHAGLDGKRRLRFQREAAAAARLHHTNIVPVFGVGEHDGLPYYVMQFIAGRGLDVVLAELRQPGRRPMPSTTTGVEGHNSPTPHPGETEVPGPKPCKPAKPWEWRAVAALGVQVAEALHHAHQQGVLHRDVKPGNILVDEHGAAWVTDFGLAKLAGEPELTNTGDLLGTLHYMAPESFQGRSDARSDIYGLGLVLGELCTLEPPQTPNPTELVRRVGGHERPGLRRLNPAVPRDLETVILKATAADPTQRYATARDLAEDLRRFLDDRPVLARRASALRRGWRWCRRNRITAGLAAVALASLVLAAVVGWVGYARSRDALAREEQRRKEAETAKKRVEENLELSLQAFEEIFRTIAPQDRAPPFRPEKPGRFGPVPKPAAGVEENVALLQSVLHFYDRFAEQNETNPRLHQDAAKAYRRVWAIQQRLGQPKKAAAALERAIGLYENLVAQYPTARDYRYELAELCAHSGPGPAETPAATEKRLRRAAGLAEGLHREAPEVGDYRLLLGEVCGRLGALLAQRGQVVEAEADYRQAVEALEQAGFRLPPAAAAQLRAARLGLAEALLDRGEICEAGPLLEASVRAIDAALAPGGRNLRVAPELATQLAADCHRLVRLCQRAGDETAVPELLRKAKKLAPRGTGDHRVGRTREGPGPQ